LDGIDDYMISTLLSIDIDSSVREAAMFMMANNIGSLLAKRFDEYVGIVTETELARKVLGKGLNRETIGIEEVMTSPFFSMDRYLPVEEANRFIHKNKIRHLRVTK
jgi:signal-transduction protein with cAMP-binding, CBS, and nucleotidyltransferase domain